VIDTHTHVYLPEFNADRTDVIQRARTAGVTQLLLPNIDSRSIDDTHRLADEHPSVCLPMMGLHPCSVKENWKEELEVVKDWLFGSKRRYVGVGEIGLDYYWDKTFVTEQQAALRKQLEWAALIELPFSMHTREATDDCIDIVIEVQQKHPKLRGVFHCFGGTLDQARRIVGLNCMVGIGGVVTYKKAGLDVVLNDVPLEHVVLETDAPYLSPVPFRGKRNEPAYLVHVVNKLSKIYGVDTNAVNEQTDRNAVAMFRLKA
jgi:TatD DNase family protein